VWFCKRWVWSFFSFAADLLHVWSDLCNWVMSNTSHFPWQQQPQPWIHWLCARAHTTVESIKSNKTNAWFRVVIVMFPWWQRDNLSLTPLRLNTECTTSWAPFVEEEEEGPCKGLLHKIEALSRTVVGPGWRTPHPLQGASSQDWGPIKDNCIVWFICICSCVCAYMCLCMCNNMKLILVATLNYLCDCVLLYA
jgi:hypothetical protein